MLLVRLPGSGAQTNMLPWLSGTFQPTARRPPQRASRRRWYSAHWALTLSSGPVSAAMAAFWMGRNMPKSIWVRSFLQAATTSGRPTRKLIRAPVTLKLLLRLKNSTATSSAPGVLKTLPPTRPSKMMSL